MVSLTRAALQTRWEMEVHVAGFPRPASPSHAATVPVPLRSQFRAETRGRWTQSGQQKTGLNRLRSHLNCWDPSRCRCWVSPRWMDCPAYLPFQQARRAGLQNGVLRFIGGNTRLLRSDRESSEVTSNPDPTGGLGVLWPRSDRSRSSAPKSG